VPAYIADQVEIRDGHPAIEISALFEDAVVEVRHLSDPRGGRVSLTTRAILASGVAALLVLLVLFGVSFVQVGRARNEREEWERSGQPGLSLPSREGTGRDVAGAGLLLYGAGALLSGLFRRAGERREPDFTIGPAPGVTFTAPGEGLPAARFPLVRAAGDDYELLFTPAMTGEATPGEQRAPIPLATLSVSGAARPAEGYPGAFALPLHEGACASLRHGENTFNIAAVARPRRYPVPFAINWDMQVYTAGVFLAVATFLLIVFSVPPDPRSLSVDAFLRDQRMISILVKPPEVKEDSSWLDKQKEEASHSPAHKDPVGKAGSLRAKERPVVARTDKPVDREAMKADLQAEVRTMGALGVLTSSHTLDRILATNTLGDQASDTLNALVGTEVVDPYGNPYGNIVSSSRGPGGGGDDAIAVGPLNRIGTGCCGHGPGNHDSDRFARLAARKAGVPDPPLPPVVNLVGTLDKDIIRRTIRQHVNEVKFCYERELTRDNSLEGRVMVQFTIATTGQVVSSVVQGSTLRNAQVEQCISSAVRRWQFPRPPGGIVIVSYPFLLKNGG
jgi:TonB family protein